MSGTFLVVGFGAIGVLSRHLIDQWVSQRFSLSFPLSTFTINCLGAFAMGLVFFVGFERAYLERDLAVALSAGFIGGFTTFSAFSLQTLQLLEQRQIALALAYLIGSPILGLAAAFAGVSLGRALGK